MRFRPPRSPSPPPNRARETSESSSRKSRILSSFPSSLPVPRYATKKGGGPEGSVIVPPSGWHHGCYSADSGASQPQQIPPVRGRGGSGDNVLTPDTLPCQRYLRKANSMAGRGEEGAKGGRRDGIVHALSVGTARCHSVISTPKTAPSPASHPDTPPRLPPTTT